MWRKGSGNRNHSDFPHTNGINEKGEEWGEKKECMNRTIFAIPVQGIYHVKSKKKLQLFRNIF